ncbi:L-aspartate oxidase [Bryobacter aggregatus]|uniref:L-aspartate oxidase n=1 Tax=Bryobacter aggregatus TaxID=360054 RepID=UPI0006914311|nr:L-aspartate oxidase [Bryobacter aggregatus]
MSFDFLVVGAGVAGLRAAITLAEHGTVLVVAKDTIEESSTEYAQGGIAVALSDDDNFTLHFQDTLLAGDGLCYEPAVAALVQEGPARIEELLAWGANFDKENGQFLMAREGAHSRSRVLHAGGDSTGHEIARSLYEKARSLPNLRFESFAAVTDLLIEDGQVIGAVAYDQKARVRVNVYSRAVLLATGGAGQLFLNTTNPSVATGDGIGIAYRAGAEVADVEFIQFHPTALYIPGRPRFLLSEALRGEGALLRNINGERFMQRYHPMEELAPRDVVSRSIVAEMRATHSTHVLLDLSHKDAAWIRQRFPTIYETCFRFGIDLTKQAAPVHPAAHYIMGGVRTDLHGRTSVNGLFAAGEAACTGVHGANRLASNSLLEGVVFGARAGEAMLGAAKGPELGRTFGDEQFPLLKREQLQTLAWDGCGILRDAAGISAVLHAVDQGGRELIEEPDRKDYERRNLATVLRLVAKAALLREESRGGHYRLDFPAKQDPPRHSQLKRGVPTSLISWTESS